MQVPPCPALPLALPSLALPSPALPSLALPLPLPCPISNFPCAARDRRRKLHRDRRKKLHRELFFPFVARDRRRKLHRERAVLFFFLLPRTGGRNYTGNGQLPGTAHIDRHQTYRHVALICRIHCKSPNGCK